MKKFAFVMALALSCVLHAQEDGPQVLKKSKKDICNELVNLIDEDAKSMGLAISHVQGYLWLDSEDKNRLSKAKEASTNTIKNAFKIKLQICNLLAETDPETGE